MNFSEYDEKNFMVKKLKPKKVKVLHPETLRFRTSRRQNYIKTTVPMEKRTLKNLPRYANKKPKVHFKDWLGIEMCKDTKYSVGKAQCNGKYYGFSHRAIASFGIGDKITKTSCGNEGGKEYTIKTDDQAKEAAINFAKEIS